MSVEARVGRIFDLVIEERKKQIGKWGKRPAPPTLWFILILLWEYTKLIYMLVIKRFICGNLLDHEENYLMPLMAVALLWLEKLEKMGANAVWQPPRVNQSWRGVGTPGGKQ